MEGRCSVCVSGLPPDVEAERLADKLHIHFLRSKNGGGEITSVTIKPERVALITFEESTVALNVLSHCPHILEVDGKKYELSLSFPGQDSSVLNKVILDMSLTIDCSQLPLGEETINNLCKQYPGLHVQFIRSLRHCILYGLYSKVQALLAHLVELLANSDLLEAECSASEREKRVGSGSLEKQDSRQEDLPHRLQFGGLDSQYQETKASEILLQNSGQEGNGMDLSQAHSAERKDWINEADMEDLSLIMEADVFAYLSSRSEQYKHILLSHGVHVVDVTSEGVTTLYLQSNAKVKTVSEQEKCMRQALKELNHLYQKMESNLRRAQIPRSALGVRGGNTEAFKELQSLLPKVLLSYDQTHVYIVGESSEVSQAKQILLLGSGNGQGLRPSLKKESAISTSWSNSYSSTCKSEITQMTEESAESRALPPKTSASERKCKGGEEYKLAARFRNSEKGLPGFYSGEKGKDRDLQDLTTNMNVLRLTSSSEPTPPSRSSLGLGGTVHEKKGGPIRVTGVNCTEEDILFQKMDPPSLVNTFNTKDDAEFTSTFTPTVKVPPPSLNVHSGLDKHKLSSLRTAVTPKTSLKRANSFSGRPSQKEDAPKIGICETSVLSSGIDKRSKTNQYSCRKPVEEVTNTTISREVTVSTVMWNYMKEAYRSRLDDLISDLQVTESLSDKDEIKVILEGSDLSKVEECQSKLQRLVGMIDTDFCVQELRLMDFGVTESSDVFKACCSNIRSRFGKILLRSAKDTVVLIGPELLCSMATEMLKEAFHEDVSNSVPHIDSFTQRGTIDQDQANNPADQAQFQSERQMPSNQSNADQESLEGHCMNQALRHKDCQSETWNVNCFHSPKQKPAVKEKAKNGPPGYLDTMKTRTILNQSSERNEVPAGLRDDRLHSLSIQKKQKTTTMTLKQTNLQAHKSEQCVCGESGAHLSQAHCGVFLCPHCLPLHSQCIVCSEEKAPKETSQNSKVHLLRVEETLEDCTRKEGGKQQKQAQGIHGTMAFVEIPLSLPGHSRYTTAKITYYIPDGIQGEEHTNPGTPFKGGVFEAYLPLSPNGRSLLPCLKKAFEQGLTFKVCPNDTSHGKRARIGWNRIPHKTKTEGGKSGNGYPDSTYLHDLSEALKTYGIEAVTLSKSKAKT